MTAPAGDTEGVVFDIDTFAVHDGPGIRMAVYLKGCPLACKWCHSPESLSPRPELIFMRDRCRLCGRCVGICPRDVHHVNGSGHVLWRDRCVACGDCVARCPDSALAVKGDPISAAAVISKAVRLKPFFDHSGGGITLTGGEVTMQVEFAEAVLSACRSQGIHTAIETCGACGWDRLERLVAHADLVLYDLKLVDEAAHQEWTGAANRQILENAGRLAGREVQVRVPLIPGITDTEDNLRGLFGFMRRVGLLSVALLPYNCSAPAKYEWLGLRYEVAGETQDPETLARAASLADGAGIQVAVW